jgi:GT2 family glycosyltransferase/SAM-dependent methyltransferase
MTSYEPLDVLHVDLTHGLQPLTDSSALDGRDIYAVFWRAGIPLGHAEITRDELTHPPALAQIVATKIAPAVGDRLLPGLEGSPIGLTASEAHTTVPLSSVTEVSSPLAQIDLRMSQAHQRAAALRVSVIVCTRGRPEELGCCLRSLLEMSASAEEIVVVDNSSSGEALAVVHEMPGITYVSEPRPGLSRARNAGLRVATGDIIAFTDDDTTVHRDWVRRLREGFIDPNVMSVTGLVLPARLDTPSQVTFEKAMGGFGQGYQRIVYNTEFMRRTKNRGTPVWRVGAGANMAIRREAFQIVGEFDERLGAGAAGCSEDSEFWYRLLAEGWQCLYEPAAVVFHNHRSDFRALRRQARAYIRGHVAALFVQYARYRHAGNLVRAFVVMPHHLAKRAGREYLLRRPSGILWSYASGYLSGLRFLHLAIRRDRTTPHTFLGASPKGRRPAKVDRRRFLRANPYAHPLSVGIFYREKMRAIHRVAPDGHFERILEVGGGQSGLTALLYPGAEVVNIDIESSYASSRLNQRMGTRFVCGDATRLPLADRSFDGITLFDVLEHVPDDRLAIMEVLRVLRPAGFVVISSPNNRWRFPYYRLMRSLCPTDAQIMAEWGHSRRGYAGSQLQELLGGPPVASESYITPITAVGHDLAFSKLPGRWGTLACVALSPLTWVGYWLNRGGRRGIETASSWRLHREG